MAEVYDLGVRRSSHLQAALMERVGKYIGDGECDPSVLGLDGVEKNILLGLRWHVQMVMASIRPTPPAIVELYEAIDAAVQAEIKRLTALWAK